MATPLYTLPSGIHKHDLERRTLMVIYVLDYNTYLCSKKQYDIYLVFAPSEKFYLDPDGRHQVENRGKDGFIKEY